MTTDYKIYLTFNNEQSRINIPVLPEKVDISQGTNNQTIDIIGLGETVVIGDLSALTISFESVFPADKCDGKGITEKVMAWMHSKKPVHLIISGMDINMFCSIESFEYYEQGGDVGSIYYSISLKEYREVTFKQITVKGVQFQKPRIDNRVTPTTYKVKKGDSLYNVAKKELGSPEKWVGIASINKLKPPYSLNSNQIIKLKY